MPLNKGWYAIKQRNQTKPPWKNKRATFPKMIRNIDSKLSYSEENYFHIIIIKFLRGVSSNYTRKPYIYMYIHIYI